MASLKYTLKRLKLEIELIQVDIDELLEDQPFVVAESNRKKYSSLRSKQEKLCSQYRAVNSQIREEERRMRK